MSLDSNPQRHWTCALQKVRISLYALQALSRIALSACLCMLPLMASAQSALPVLQVGQAAPDFALRTLQQQNLRLSEFRGEVVLVNFWAGWCGECRQAMPALNAMYQKYNRAGLVMLSVNVDDEAHRAVHMSESLNILFPVLFDERKEVVRLYSLERMPLTVVIDRAGTVQQMYVGYHKGDERKYLEHIRQLLNE
jgi:peroxiredoxin